MKPFNVAVKKKTELFTPKAIPVMASIAKVIIESLSVATITRWEHPALPHIVSKKVG